MSVVLKQIEPIKVLTKTLRFLLYLKVEYDTSWALKIKIVRVLANNSGKDLQCSYAPSSLQSITLSYIVIPKKYWSFPFPFYHNFCLTSGGLKEMFHFSKAIHIEIKFCFDLLFRWVPRTFAFEISFIVTSGLTIMIPVMTGFASLFFILSLHKTITTCFLILMYYK